MHKLSFCTKLRAPFMNYEIAYTLPIVDTTVSTGEYIQYPSMPASILGHISSMQVVVGPSQFNRGATCRYMY